MGLFDKLFGRKKREPSVDRVKKEVWDASPQSRCGVCGKPIRGLSGGVISGSGEDFMKMMLEGMRYVCPRCGFQSCFKCCADTRVSKVLCKKCGSEMRRG